jgi:hypothetical protein
MRFRILLIIHDLIREILMKRVLDVHARGVKIKVSRSKYCNDVFFTEKGSWKNTYVGMHTKNHMFFMISW